MIKQFLVTSQPNCNKMSHIMNKNVITALVLTGMIASSCTKKVTMSTIDRDIIGKWIVTEIDGTAVAEAETMPFINFTDSGVVNGNMSVNHFFGQYRVSGDTLSFGNLGMTQMFGPNMEQEASINRALGNCCTVELTNALLKMKDKDGKVLITLKRN